MRIKRMMMNSTSTGPSSFPSLPIINAPVPGRSQREKYGSMLYLGIAGLFVVLGPRRLVRLSVLDDARRLGRRSTCFTTPRRPTRRGCRRPSRLSRDPRVEQRQLWEMSLRRGLPELARYILAEGIGTELGGRGSAGLCLGRRPEPRLARLAPPGPHPPHGLRRDRRATPSRARPWRSSAARTTRSSASGPSTPWRSRPSRTPRPSS